MDNKQLQDHLDARFDRLEGKLDIYAVKTVENSERIKGLKGSVALIITVIVGFAGILVTAYFNLIKA